MTTKFLTIQFTGEYGDIVKFLDSKGWTYEIKIIGHNKLLLKINEESAEELELLRGHSIDKFNEVKITDVISF